MNWRAALSRVLRPLMSYSDLEERAFADHLRRYNATGITVTEQSALQQAAVWACVRVISETLATLPVEVIERVPGTRRREVLETHALVYLANTSPDGELSAFHFRELLLSHALVWGNAYAEIERDLAGRPYALHMVTPDRVRAKRLADRSLVYGVRQADGTEFEIPARDMLHLAGLGWDGTQGYSVVAMAQQSLGLNAATETFAGAFFGNNMQLGTVYSTDAALKPDQATALREQLEEMHRGAGKAFRAALLTHGLKPGEPPMPLKDAQFLEGRRFGVLEVCRWFRVPPHLVMELDRATHANVEQEQLAFVMHCLAPWARRLEAAMDLKLLGRNEQARRRVRHNFDELLRGDMKSRYESYHLARQDGWLNANEIRDREDMNGIGADGEQYLVPANMTTPEKVAAPEPAPAPPAAPPAGPQEPQEPAASAGPRLLRSAHA